MDTLLKIDVIYVCQELPSLPAKAMY